MSVALSILPAAVIAFEVLPKLPRDQAYVEDAERELILPREVSGQRACRVEGISEPPTFGGLIVLSSDGTIGRRQRAGELSFGRGLGCGDRHNGKRPCLSVVSILREEVTRNHPVCRGITSCRGGNYHPVKRRLFFDSCMRSTESAAEPPTLFSAISETEGQQDSAADEHT